MSVQNDLLPMLSLAWLEITFEKSSCKVVQIKKENKITRILWKEKLVLDLSNVLFNVVVTKI